MKIKGLVLVDKWLRGIDELEQMQSTYYIESWWISWRGEEEKGDTPTKCRKSHKPRSSKSFKQNVIFKLLYYTQIFCHDTQDIIVTIEDMRICKQRILMIINSSYLSLEGTTCIRRLSLFNKNDFAQESFQQGWFF